MNIYNTSVRCPPSLPIGGVGQCNADAFYASTGRIYYGDGSAHHARLIGLLLAYAETAFGEHFDLNDAFGAIYGIDIVKHERCGQIWHFKFDGLDAESCIASIVQSHPQYDVGQLACRSIHLTGKEVEFAFWQYGERFGFAAVQRSLV